MCWLSMLGGNTNDNRPLHRLVVWVLFHKLVILLVINNIGYPSERHWILVYNERSNPNTNPKP